MPPTIFKNVQMGMFERPQFFLDLLFESFDKFFHNIFFLIIL